MKVLRFLRPIKAKVWLGIFLFFGVLVGGVWRWGIFDEKRNNLSPLSGEVEERDPEFLKYAFLKLAEREYAGSEIKYEREFVGGKGYKSWMFSYQSSGKKVSGQANIPQGAVPENGWPVVVMLRGWVDPEDYATGVGTKNAAAYFASRGFATFAPDFLGYGESDDPMKSALGARVRRPVTVLDLLASLGKLEKVDEENVFLWGHSNGGQIALSVMEILGMRVKYEGSTLAMVKGASLWAPMSKSFPYGILYYTDEYSDKGKELRRVLAEFEREHDVSLYSIDNYWEYVKAPLQIHQGTADDSVPKEWSDELVEKLKDVSELQGPTLKYFEYRGANHNLRPSWGTVVRRDVEFFRSLVD